MNKLGTYILLIAGCLTLFSGCSDKNSNEACIHQVTMDLDHGKYDAVLASGCADAMQKGAAYFGKAGFDIKTVINRFSETGVSSSSTSTTSDLTVYMTALVGQVDEISLSYIDSSRSEYVSVPPTASLYKDAQFYLSLVNAMKSLSLIKFVIPNLVNPDGTLNMSCDVNNDKVPDEADATACALTAAVNGTSTGICTTATGSINTTYATYSRSTPTDIYLDNLTSRVSGTYSGLIITMTTTTPLSTPTCTTTSYKRLLYKNAAGNYWAATTTSSLCTNSTISAETWPCPLTGANLDLVTAIDTSLNSMVNALNTSVTVSTSSDVNTAITDLKTNVCKSSCSAVCPGASCPESCQSGATIYCSSQDISSYITTSLK